MSAQAVKQQLKALQADNEGRTLSKSQQVKPAVLVREPPCFNRDRLVCAMHACSRQKDQPKDELAQADFGIFVTSFLED